MKSLSLSLFLLLVLMACNPAPKEPKTDSINAADAQAITALIHGFYTWYDAFQMDTTKGFDFTDANGEHLKLIPSRLDAYLDNFKQSGLVSDDFIKAEKAFYQSCEKLWQNEAVDDVPSCLDADKYFCAQDWEIEKWTSSPVEVTSISADKAKATMHIQYGEDIDDRNFEVVKINGKWLISVIECQMLPE